MPFLTQLQSLSNSPYALLILSILSFSESAFFIIPPEVLMLPLSLANQSLSLLYALITTIASVAGAMFGHWIGQKGGKPLLKKLFSQEKIDKVKNLYQKYDAWALIVAAITPIPFKVFTIAAGVFDVDFKRLVIASAVGRGSRYFTIGLLMFIFGESIRGFIENQFDKALLIFTLVIIVAALLYKIVWPFIESKLTHQTLKDKLLSFIKRK